MHIFRWILVTAVIFVLVNPTEAWRTRRIRKGLKRLGKKIRKAVKKIEKPLKNAGCKVGSTLSNLQKHVTVFEADDFCKHYDKRRNCSIIFIK